MLCSNQNVFRERFKIATDVDFRLPSKCQHNWAILTMPIAENTLIPLMLVNRNSRQLCWVGLKISHVMLFDTDNKYDCATLHERYRRCPSQQCNYMLHCQSAPLIKQHILSISAVRPLIGRTPLRCEKQAHFRETIWLWEVSGDLGTSTAGWQIFKLVR